MRRRPLRADARAGKSTSAAGGRISGNRLYGMQGKTDYPRSVATVKTTAIPKLDGFFEEGEQAISAYLNNLADQVEGVKVNQLKGQGATAHTVYTVKPKSGGQPASHATQCSWALQKLKVGGPGNSVGSLPPSLTDADPLATFHDGLSGPPRQRRESQQPMAKGPTGIPEHASRVVGERVSYPGCGRAAAYVGPAPGWGAGGVERVSGWISRGHRLAVSTLFDPNTGWLGGRQRDHHNHQGPGCCAPRRVGRGEVLSERPSAGSAGWRMWCGIFIALTSCRCGRGRADPAIWHGLAGVSRSER